MNKKNYSILSVKILKAGIEVSYYDMKTDRNVNIEDKKNSPHPDFTSAIMGFDEYLARTHLLPEDKYAYVSSTGFSIKSDTIIVLKGTLTAPSEKKLAINSDAIDLTKESYGFESDLQLVVDEVVKEAGKYLFEGKMISQSKIDFGSTEDPDKSDGNDLSPETKDEEDTSEKSGENKVKDATEDVKQYADQEQSETATVDTEDQHEKEYADREPDMEKYVAGADPTE